MKNRQFIVLCCLIVIGFCVLYIQNKQTYNYMYESVDNMLRANNHEHQLIMEKLGN